MNNHEYGPSNGHTHTHNHTHTHQEGQCMIKWDTGGTRAYNNTRKAEIQMATALTPIYGRGGRRPSDRGTRDGVQSECGDTT